MKSIAALPKTIFLFFIAACVVCTATERRTEEMIKDKKTALTTSLEKEKDNDAAITNQQPRQEKEETRTQRSSPDESYVLPVVFHVVNEDPDSVTDSQILQAVQDLNDAFSKRGKYSGSQGADTKIQFCLANKDPDGGSTTGITRTEYYFGNDLAPDIEDDKLKGLIQWDPLHYINIWYVVGMHKEISASFSCGVWSRMQEGGYATLPPNAGPLDGIVVTGFGPVLAHEMGHYLGLLHTFEGGCNNYNCKTDGDGVCDTPPEYLPYSNASSCGAFVNSCSTDTLSGFSKDMPDLKADFMDYSDAACQNEFTEGQAERMRRTIASQRSTLLDNKCDKPCAENSVAAFTRDNAYPVPGNLIHFTNTSTGATNYQWLVNDVAISSSKDFSYTVETAGKYKVTLKAYNGDASCFASYTDYVTVTCGVRARFYTDKQYIASRVPLYPDSLIFTNTSENATSYQWRMSTDNGVTEQVVATSKDLVYVFPLPGNYLVRLIATNGSCTDTTEYFTVPVDEPTQDGAAYVYNVYCYKQTQVQLSIYFCNYGYAPIPAGTPVSFYDADPRLGNAHKLSPSFYLPDAIPGHCCGWVYTHTIDVKAQGLNQIYTVFNDSGTTMPLKLPNTKMNETNYDNNISFLQGFAFKASIAPPSATLEPGDTLLLQAFGSPTGGVAFNWYPAYNLSCANCAATNLIADTTSAKSVIVTSAFGCYDTAHTKISVPPADDYTIAIDNIQCAAGDSIHLNFTLSNGFKRGIIPKGLTVAFYNGNPATAGTALLPGLFSVPLTVQAKTATFETTIQGITSGTIYAVVNDSGRIIPVKLPATPILEKDYTNNTTSVVYNHLKITTVPAEATLEPGDTLQLYATNANGTGVSYHWAPSFNLSCTACDTTYLIADSNRTKRVVATNEYGCTDTAYTNIKVPPADDYTVVIDDVQCAAGDSLHIAFTLSNGFKRGILPKGLPVAFYSADPSGNAASLLSLFALPATVNAKTASFIKTIKSAAISSLYAMVNDSVKGLPVSLPNTSFLEKDYTNNKNSFAYQPLSVITTPTEATLEPGDTLKLYATASPGNIVSYNWSPPLLLRCTACDTTYLIADSNRTKQVAATNSYGCIDTASVDIKVPPSDDFTVAINDIQCASDNRLFVSFTLSNLFKRGVLHKGVTVSFYNGNPSQSNAVLLSPVFTVPATIQAKQASFATYIQGIPSGTIYAVVNDNGISIPINLPNTAFLEKDYTNNTADTLYQTQQISLLPADTTILRKTSFTPVIASALFNAASTIWLPGNGYRVSCTNCISPLVTVTDSGTLQMQSLNQYGCPITGESIIKIIPPDYSIQLLKTECFTSYSTLVSFRVCVANNYDSLAAKLPVAFYDKEPSATDAVLLSPVFYTSAAVPDTCAVYTHIVQMPATGKLYARVNDRGNAGNNLPDYQFAETDYDNNNNDTTAMPFSVSILPADTSLMLYGSVPLVVVANSDTLLYAVWQPARYLTCSSCISPVARPPYTTTFSAVAYNQYSCVDTAYVIVKTFTGGEVNIPTGFTPNADGRNDVFYILAGKEVSLLNDFAVYDRWGKPVFHVSHVVPNTPVYGWDGTVNGISAPAGTYIYQLVVQFADGLQRSYRGTVVLIK